MLIFHELQSSVFSSHMQLCLTYTLYVCCAQCFNRYTRKQLAPAPRSGILSSLGQHFPSIFNIFKKQHQQLNNLEKVILSKSPHASNEINSPGIKDTSETNSLGGTADDTVVISGKTLNPLGDAEEEFRSSRFFRVDINFTVRTNDNISWHLQILLL